ncbi:hypothetical protein OG204_00500 [Streptomyces sp. NBC_01387]
MEISNAPRHPVNQQRLDQALGDKTDRVQERFEDVYQRGYPMRVMLEELGHELLDHVAARTTQDPDLDDERTRLALLTAAECRLGVLDRGCFPHGDWEIPLPLTGTRLTSEELDYDEMHDATDTVTARTWVDAFDMGLVENLAEKPEEGLRGGWTNALVRQWARAPSGTRGRVAPVSAAGQLTDR